MNVSGETYTNDRVFCISRDDCKKYLKALQAIPGTVLLNTSVLLDSRNRKYSEYMLKK